MPDNGSTDNMLWKALFRKYYHTKFEIDDSPINWKEEFKKQSIVDKKISKNQYDLLLKILLIGDSGVGKSEILRSITDDMYTDVNVQTIGVDFKIATRIINNLVIKAQIWDTAGQERFSYYRGAHLIILVFNVEDSSSFRNTCYWLAEVERYASDTILKLLVGNQLSVQATREVTKEEAQHFAAEKSTSIMKCANVIDIPYIEVNSATKEFHQLVKVVDDQLAALVTSLGATSNTTEPASQASKSSSSSKSKCVIQ